MARCSTCDRFSRFMETDEFAVPPSRPALVHPDADGVRTPSALGLLSPEDPPPAFMERDWRHGGDNTAAYPGCSPFQPSAAGRPVSISLPASPTGGFDISSRTEAELQRDAAAVTDAPPPRMMMLPPFAPAPAMALEQPSKVVFRSQPIPAAPPEGDGAGGHDEFGRSAPAAMALEQPGKVVFRSQPIIPGAPPEGDGAARGHDDFGRSAPAAKTRRDSRDTSYDSFKTWSGKLEKQIATHLLGSSLQQQPEHGEEPEEDDAASDRRNSSSMPKVQRFFAALEGPELDKLSVGDLFSNSKS